MRQLTTLFLAGLSIAAMAGSTGCGRSRAHDDRHGRKAAGHDHGHAADAISVLRFGKHTELFVEHPPLVAGQPVTFTAHFTRLGRRFTPVRKGSLLVTLSGAAGEVMRIRSTKPARTGIFVPQGKAPAAGSYRLSFSLDAAGAKDEFAWQVTVYRSKTAAKARPKSQDEPGEISFLKEQQWTIDFATAPAQRRAIGRGIEVAGTIDAEPGAHARLTAPIGGVVTRVSEALRVGAKIPLKQSLATVEPVLLHGSDLPKLQLALVHARQALKLAELRRDRLRGMYKARAVSQLEMDRAEYEVKRQQAALQAAGSRLWLHQKKRKRQRTSEHGIHLQAPIAGTVVHRGITQGAAVVPGQLLVEIADLSRLRVLAHVPSADLDRARKAQHGSVRLPSGQWITLDGRPVLGARVDTRTRTVPVYFSWTAKTTVPLGTWVRVRLLERETVSTAVPSTAVLDNDGQAVVLVQTGGESFVLRKVAVGTQDRGWSEILMGLRPGERVVTVGGYQLLLTTKLSGGVKLGHGHAH